MRKILKRKANLIPFRINGNELEFFLSLRSKNAKQYPNIWSFWGGEIMTNERPEETLVREIEEELKWIPIKYDFLGVYFDSMPNEKHIYHTRVEMDFEKRIRIQEGQGGRFFNFSEIKKEERMIDEDKKPIVDLHSLLSSTKTSYQQT